ncbi:MULTISPECIES: type IV toxin-antitoxin system AbiEi family antitoxin [unclassified Microbacterium]|uniref:type IV toxin-antitoxin system AbiEi family antitoxin n=1 Tax=unclassified Microbacterium TaxID=2609290 RepID=UPI00365CB8F6
MRDTFLHVPGARLSLPELAAARLDGDVVELGEGYAPADLVETAALRAASLIPLVAGMRDAAFAGMTAAWIHGASDAPPDPHELQSATGHRLRAPTTRRIIVHDPVLDPSDVQHLGGIAVTTPERTLIDLLRWPATVPERHDWARLLALTDPALIPRAAARLAQLHHGPGYHRVARFLAGHGADGRPAEDGDAPRDAASAVRRR